MHRITGFLITSLLTPTLLLGETMLFQEGVEGYTHQEDLCINPAGGIWTSDARLAMDASPRYQALIRFDYIFGVASNQIPPSAEIMYAAIKLKTGSRISSYSGTINDIGIYQVNVAWTEQSRWGDFSTLGDTLGAKAVSTLIGTYTTTISNDETTSFDITAAAKAWHAGTSTNHGILLVNDGNDGCDFWSDASPNVHERPILEVNYIMPPSMVPSISSDLLELTFQAESNIIYQPQWCTNITDGSWQNAGGGVTGINSVITWQHTISGQVDQSYFRLTINRDP